MADLLREDFSLARPRSISDEQILQTARDCFLEHGPAVSTEVIAQQLGVSPQALFKRFHSKQELMLEALAPEEPARWIPKVAAGPDDRDLSVQLKEILTELAEFFMDISRRMSVLRWGNVDFDQLLARYAEPPPLVEIRALAGWFERAFDRGLIRSVDCRAMAMLVLTAMHGPAMLTDMLSQHPTGHSQEEYVEIIVEVLLRGLLNEVCGKGFE